MSWLEIQNEFLAILQRQETSTSPILLPGCNSQRIQAYQRNIFWPLMNSLQKSYPSVQLILGDESFKYFCQQYVRLNPSLEPDLNRYGQHFDVFLEKHEQLQDFQFLKDLACIDWHLHKSYYDKATVPQSPKSVDLSRPKQVRIKYTSGTYFLQFDRSIFTLWNAIKVDEDIARLHLYEKQSILIYRDEYLIPQVSLIEPKYEDILRKMKRGSQTLDDLLSIKVNSLDENVAFLKASLVNNWLHLF